MLGYGDGLVQGLTLSKHAVNGGYRHDFAGLYREDWSL